MKNCHYVPRLILRRFASKKDRICLYNLKNHVFTPDVKLDDAFAIEGFYPDDLETKFNEKTESQFAQLTKDLILSAKDGKIRLTRTQLQRIKKFLLLLIIRSTQKEEWIESERRLPKFFEALGITDDFLFPFKEKEIEGESNHDYWLRSMNCILDSKNALPEELEKDENATHMAWRWAWVMKSAYLAFWSNKGTDIDFLVTDVGMTSENEKSIGKHITMNPQKINSLIACAQTSTSKLVSGQFWAMASRQVYFHENFMEFPFAKNLMVVLINPYFKVFYTFKDHGYTFPPFEALTGLTNKKAFAPNKNTYVQMGEFNDDDIFEYEIHNLTRENCFYLNALTLDRINETLGFSNPKKILSSLEYYQSIPNKLNDYSELINQIKEKK